MRAKDTPANSPKSQREPVLTGSGCGCGVATERIEKTTLRRLLAINGLMFVIEIVAGWRGDSAGLLADSLDMLADASVYGISLFAVGRAPSLQSQAARASGWIQIGLGISVQVEVIRRFMYGSEPEGILIILIGLLALCANLLCLKLLAKHRSGGIHMRASWIFSTNDVVANSGVIVSGFLVMLMGNRTPDLVIGAIVSAFVIRGGWRILRDVKQTMS